MKLFRLTALSFIFSVFFVLTAFAQAGQPGGKVAVIDTKAFENSKTGILKYFNAMSGLEKERLAAENQLKALATKHENLRKEIQTLQEQAQKNTVPVNQNTINTKIDEYEKVGREIKYKQEEANANFSKRRQEVMRPILLDIGKAMDDFAAQKGYALILDSSKLDQAGVILAVSKTADVTEEFIKFYNARPAGTAGTAKPE